MDAETEHNLTEIEILPDGRICVFGTSRQVLEVLDELVGGRDDDVRGRLEAAAGVAPPGKKTTITQFIDP